MIQRGPDGDFAFVISKDFTAEGAGRVKVAQIDRGQALIEEGSSPGERVVVDGQYELQAGSKVKLPDSTTAGEHQSPRTNAAGPSAWRV